ARRRRSSARWASATSTTSRAGSRPGRRRWIRRSRSTEPRPRAIPQERLQPRPDWRRLAVIPRGPDGRVAAEAAPAGDRRSEAAAGVEPGLLLRRAVAAQRAVAVREAAEAFDHLQVRPRVAGVARVAERVEQRDRAVLVGEVLRMLERQV